MILRKNIDSTLYLIDRAIFYAKEFLYWILLRKMSVSL